ncbi:hypothetical protein D3C71_1525810 [compost metagenome]
MAMAASVGPTLEATAGEKTWRSSMGRKARPAVSTMPTSKAPTKAPRIEPMPPMTMHTSTRIRISSPMPTCTEVIGPSSAPATAASMAPSTNTPRNSRGTRTPIKVAIWRLEAPARTSTPARVRVTNQYRPAAAATPNTMIIRR